MCGSADRRTGNHPGQTIHPADALFWNPYRLKKFLHFESSRMGRAPGTLSGASRMALFGAAQSDERGF
jgi:hypothetical protein